MYSAPILSLPKNRGTIFGFSNCILGVVENRGTIQTFSACIFSSAGNPGLIPVNSACIASITSNQGPIPFFSARISNDEWNPGTMNSKKEAHPMMYLSFFTQTRSHASGGIQSAAFPSHFTLHPSGFVCGTEIGSSANFSDNARSKSNCVA